MEKSFNNDGSSDLRTQYAEPNMHKTTPLKACTMVQGCSISAEELSLTNMYRHTHTHTHTHDVSVKAYAYVLHRRKRIFSLQYHLNKAIPHH